MTRNIALVNNNDKELAKRELEVGYITYKTLAERVKDMILCNNIENRLYDTLQLENGCITRYYDENENELTEEEAAELDSVTEKETDLYQWYIISDSGAEYLKDVSDELVFYDSELDVYVWGVTHFGTSWNGVFTDIKATENIDDLF